MKCLTVVPFVATLLVGPATLSPRTIDPPSSEQDNPRQVMLILRGIANAENPRGQLDDEAALTYAGRLRFKGEVLDIAGDNYAGNPQVEKALERIRADRTIAAIYGFSGGGYNVRLIWKQLEPSQPRAHSQDRGDWIAGSDQERFPGNGRGADQGRSA